MKQLTLTLLLFAWFTSMAQVTVEERSGKKPSWVDGLISDYIIVVGSASTIQDAQQNALSMVKERIVSAVAENVQTSSELRVEESTRNNISTYLQNFATTTTTTSGPVPFLQGVSLSKVDEFYWEKTVNIKDKTVRYNYHIKYPFPKTELWNLVSEFKKRDNEMTQQLDELLEAVATVTSVEDIDKSIGELRILADYFMDSRKDKANLVINRYRSLYSSIQFVEIESGLGELKYGLRLGDKFIQTNKKPQVRSECARITNTVSEKEYTLIKYDFTNCFDNPENNINVSYRFGNNTVQKAFYFDITADKAAIFVNEPFRFSATSTESGLIESAILDITLVSKYQAPFTIVKVELDLPGQSPIIIDNIGKSFVGKGNHKLQLQLNHPIKSNETTTADRRIAMLSGYIHFKSDITGEVKTYRIYNHTYTTNW
jgi:hypothetical protein